ncbi:MAG: hypothetical protein NC310_04575 [Roseburia sp.]|nr:hypothetical protein [Anaeroplasma bactoclasticum]MCM1196336.1 hypothetical protein [Roseburia sp.]MCM1557553.1 hypothetical protein [Anaeroplasma bactoclasticum]
MVIKNITIFSGDEAIEEISNYAKRQYYKKYIFSGILGVLGIIVISLIATQGNSIDTMVIGLLFLAFAIILVLINTYSIVSIKKRIRKRNPQIVEHGMINSFIFKEESFSLQVKIGDKVSKLEYPYQALKKIIEYDDRICFIITDNDFYACKKTNFSSQKELEQFFYGLTKHKTKIQKKLSKENAQK